MESPTTPAMSVTSAIAPVPPEDYHEYIWVTKTTQMVTFRKLIEAIQSVLRDAHIEITEKGLTLRDVDALGNCCIEIQLNSFEEHYAHHKFVIAVDLQQLHTCLRHGSGELLTLSIFADKQDKMCVEFINMAKQKKSRHWIPLRKIVAQVLSISVEDMPRVVQMPNNDFQRVIREISPAAKSKLLYIRSESNYIVMGTEYDSAATEIEVHPKPNGMIWVANDPTMHVGTFTNYYYIRYLERFCKNQIDRAVTISLKPGQPLILQYLVGHLGVLYFYLGPVDPAEVAKLSSSSIVEPPPGPIGICQTPSAPATPKQPRQPRKPKQPKQQKEPKQPKQPRQPRQTRPKKKQPQQEEEGGDVEDARHALAQMHIPQDYYSKYGGYSRIDSDDEGENDRRMSYAYGHDDDDDFDGDTGYGSDMSV